MWRSKVDDVSLTKEGEETMSEANKGFHFNVNVRSNSGSKAAMANNENSYLRAMEIQERKWEKAELERLEKERIAAEQAALEEASKPKEEEVVNQEEETEVVEEVAPAEETAEATAPEPPVEKPVIPDSGGKKVPGPTPRSDFTSEEKAAMLKRAKAHAAEVRARKAKG